MFSDAEASALRQRFWTTFGRYMGPVPSAEGEKINWINYRTGIKDVAWKMETLNRQAKVIVLIGGSEERQEKILQIFEQLKFAENNAMILEKDTEKGNSRFIKQLPAASVLDERKWLELISFFKDNILAFDKFWTEHKFIFELNL